MLSFPQEVKPEQNAPQGASAAPVTPPIAGGSRSTSVSADLSDGGSRPRETHCSHCPQFGSKSAQSVALAAALYSPTRSGRAGRSQRQKASQCMDPAAAGGTGAEPRTEARPVWLSRQRVDRSRIDRTLGHAERAAGVRLHRAAPVAVHGLCVEATALWIAIRSGPREKSAPFGSGLRDWGRAASCSVRMRLPGCCFHPCGPVGLNAGSNRYELVDGRIVTTPRQARK
jgi:hypothetical protein